MITRSMCSKCNSANVICKAEYCTLGGDMEHVEWRHACRNCGHIDNSEIQQSCYGYNNYYSCPFPGCINAYHS